MSQLIIPSAIQAYGLKCSQLLINTHFDDTSIENSISFPQALSAVPEDHPVLRKTARSLSLLEIKSNEFQEFLKKLRAFNKKEDFFGVSATQVGVSLKVAIVLRTYSPWLLIFKELFHIPVKELVLINPEIEPIGSKMRKGMEGCKSVGHFCDIVSRYKQIKVKYQDENGIGKEEVFSDYTAVIIQHEVDHLNGILFSDISRKSLKKFDLKNAEILESNDKISLLNYLSSLNEEQRKGFISYVKKINSDLYLINEQGSLPHAFFEQSEYKTTSDVFRDLFSYYKIRIEDPYNIEAYKKWIRSEIHAVFVLEDLYTSTDSKLKSILSVLHEKNPYLKYLTLTGIKGPPFNEITNVFVPSRVEQDSEKIAQTIIFSTVSEALAFSHAISEWGIIWNRDHFEFTIRQNGQSKTMNVKSATEILPLIRSHLKSQNDKNNDINLNFTKVPTVIPYENFRGCSLGFNGGRKYFFRNIVLSQDFSLEA